MEVLGKTPINPYLFVTGKILGYITWIFMFLAMSNIEIVTIHSNSILKNISFFFLGFGVLFLALSSIFLGKNVRMGLPEEETKLKTKGIYRISRNPMYIGLGLITTASMIYTSNLFIIIFGIYSVYVYHLIIKSEELFLEKRFGDEYLNYKKKIRRYL